MKLACSSGALHSGHLKHLRINLRGKSPLMTASGLMAKSVTCTFCKGAHSPKSGPYRCQLRIAATRLGDVLDGEFNVVEVIARGVNIANTFTFQAVVISNLSGVFERVEPEYLALRRLLVLFHPC